MAIKFGKVVSYYKGHLSINRNFSSLSINRNFSNVSS